MLDIIMVTSIVALAFLMFGLARWSEKIIEKRGDQS